MHLSVRVRLMTNNQAGVDIPLAVCRPPTAVAVVAPLQDVMDSAGAAATAAVWYGLGCLAQPGPARPAGD